MALMPVIRDEYTRRELNTILQLLNQVAADLARFHSLKVEVEHASIPHLGQIIRPDRIVLNIQRHNNMLHTVNTVCHEYCHLLQYARLDQLGDVADITQDIHKFYRSEYREYCNLDLQNVLGYLVYWCSPLEIEARAFARRWGIVDMGHFLLSVDLRRIRSAYQSHDVYQLVLAEYQQMDFLLQEELDALGPDHKELLLQIVSRGNPSAK